MGCELSSMLRCVIVYRSVMVGLREEVMRVVEVGFIEFVSIWFDKVKDGIRSFVDSVKFR